MAYLWWGNYIYMLYYIYMFTNKQRKRCTIYHIWRLRSHWYEYCEYVGYLQNRMCGSGVLVQLYTRVSIRAQARARRSISQGRLGYASVAFQEIWPLDLESTWCLALCLRNKLWTAYPCIVVMQHNNTRMAICCKWMLMYRWHCCY